MMRVIFYMVSIEKKFRSESVKYLFVFLDVLIAVILLFTLYSNIFKKDTYRFSIQYGEEHSSDSYAQLYYGESLKKMTEDDSIKVNFEGRNQVDINFSMSLTDLNNRIFRLDPINTLEVYSIKGITISNSRGLEVSIPGQDINKYISSCKYIQYQMNDDGLYVVSMTPDNYIAFSQKLNYKAVKVFLRSAEIWFYIGLGLYIVLVICQLIFLRKTEIKNKIKILTILGYIVTSLVLSLGASLIYGLWYMQKNFKDVPIGQIIYHLKTPLDGTNTSSFGVVIISIALIIIGCFLIVTFAFWKLKGRSIRSLFAASTTVGGFVAVGYALILCCFHFDVITYLRYTSEESTIYEENYVDGRNITLTFPEKKRNLIYIFMESMEMSYADKSVGGAMSENYIPELTQISLDNENFGTYGKLNGAHTTPGATFTMGGLVAQTSGVPINENLISNDTLNATWESENNYVPGVWAIGDILEQEGYNQEFLIGSDKKFAGRSSYFYGHGNYDIFDYYTAIDKGYIDDDYKVWWGYEDAKLFDYAKTEIETLASKDAPFNLTMLTVDTHFTDGYVCDLCEDEYDEQYSNVIACSSKQVAEFVEWIQEQDFYENTTIVISGDHLTMDSDYIARQDATEFDRRTYFTVINGDAINEKPSVNREYTTLDLYPTTLAALGVQIEGNKLGLGVNLYSGEQTLVEQYGKDYLDIELLKDSKLYRKKILYGG